LTHDDVLSVNGVIQDLLAGTVAAARTPRDTYCWCVVAPVVSRIVIILFDGVTIKANVVCECARVCNARAFNSRAVDNKVTGDAVGRVDQGPYAAVSRSSCAIRA
jgi:hypothetical protein